MSDPASPASGPRHPAEHVVVVGGGVGGVTTCVELRRAGYAGGLVLADAGDLLHDRPPLSKEFLLGVIDEDGLRLQPDSWFAEHQVEVRLGTRVARAVPERGFVELADGERLPADAVVLATGGNARRLPVPGGDLPGVHYLRTVEDARALAPALSRGARVLVVGGGLIGAEVASTARALAAHVTLVDPLLPLEGVLGERLARYLHDMHGEHDIVVHRSGVARIDRTGDALSVSLTVEGTDPIDCDVVVVGIGMVPDTQVGENSGALIDGGVVVGPGQDTSIPGLFAVGDCTRPSDGHGTLLPRVEHWEGATHGAARAAASILRTDAPAAASEWFWTDRHGHHVEVVGHLTAPGPRVGDVPHAALEHVVRGAFGQPPFAVFALADGTLVGACAVDQPQLVRAARRLIDRGVTVDAADLADESVDLRKLAKRTKG